MKNLARTALRLGLLTLVVALAACGSGYSLNGRVSDAMTHEDVRGVSVKCMDAQGEVLGEGTSGDRPHEALTIDSTTLPGDFYVTFDSYCDHLLASDTYTPKRYADQEVPYAAGEYVINIKMARVQ